MIENTWSHYGQWGAVVFWVVLYGLFIAFLPFYRKSQRKPAGMYLAFVVAYALEMFGIPMSLYVVSWALGWTLPEGIFWGHTLIQLIGHWGMYIGTVLTFIGMAMVFVGWRIIYRRYWSQKEGHGQLVTEGIYQYVRHPQYTGFMLITLGMLWTWATMPTVIMWPILGVIYYRLAKREEQDMEQEFGSAYREYRENTGMFLPRLGLRIGQRNEDRG